MYLFFLVIPKGRIAANSPESTAGLGCSAIPQLSHMQSFFGWGWRALGSKQCSFPLHSVAAALPSPLRFVGCCLHSSYEDTQNGSSLPSCAAGQVLPKQAVCSRRQVVVLQLAGKQLVPAVGTQPCGDLIIGNRRGKSWPGLVWRSSFVIWWKRDRLHN